MILYLSNDFSISFICSTLNINRSSYYKWLINYELSISKRVSILSNILTIYAHSKGIYGAPKIKKVLERQNIFISVRTVNNYMKILGIKSIITKTYRNNHMSRISDEERSLIINLIKNLDINRPNQVWTTDITYIKTVYDSNLYLVTFIDMFTKKIVAWNLGYKMDSELVNSTLKQAIQKEKPSPGLIVHSDKGSQFRAKSYRLILSQHNFVYSYTSLNHSCDENAAQESFHSLIKKEWLYQRTLYHYSDTKQAIFEYIDGFYNTTRIHSSIGYLSPIEFEKNYYFSKNPL